MYTKYRPYPAVKMETRAWADKTATVAPVWASSDLRDGNQALKNPMTIDQKVAYFKALVDFGVKEIEVAYPSASQTEFDFCRTLIEEGMIPDDVTVGVLVPAIERHIVRSFEALKGAKRIILHLYNPTAANQREVVFRRTEAAIIDLAVQGVQWVKREAENFDGEVVFEYSPESFSQTELPFALTVSNAVIDAWGPTPEAPMILNLPNTLEAGSPNIYADRIEWISNRIQRRESVIISVHPHNDRGCAVASAELAVLAGAQRVEGTMLGNGERAGNVDLVTMAFNCYAQGIDPRLKVGQIDEILARITAITGMEVSERHPYVGAMIYSAYSGTHQDAIKKGMEHRRANNMHAWEVPYLAIDPEDIGRTYKDAVRLNSQSGKGGVAYVLKEVFGIDVPKAMQAELAEAVKKRQRGGEIGANEVLEIYEATRDKAEHNDRTWRPEDYAAHSGGQALWAMELIEKSGLRGDESILDIGCGDGKITDLLAQRTSGEVVGIDRSPEMIAYAQAAFPGQVFIETDAQALQFGARFDVVFSNAALHWVPDHEAVLRGIYRALKPGGKAALQMGGHGNAAEVFAAFEQIRPAYADCFDGFVSPYTFCKPEAYKGWLAKAGFKRFEATLLRKEMVHETADAFRGWLETTWFPYIRRVPETRRSQFVQAWMAAYLARCPRDDEGRVRIDMVRLEVFALKEKME